MSRVSLFVGLHALLVVALCVLAVGSLMRPPQTDPFFEFVGAAFWSAAILGGAALITGGTRAALRRGDRFLLFAADGAVILIGGSRLIREFDERAVMTGFRAVGLAAVIMAALGLLSLLTVRARPSSDKPDSPMW